MATVAALAIKRAHAIERLNAVAEKTGYPLVLPTHMKDTVHLQAAQLDTLAEWAETAFSGTQDITITDEVFAKELRRRMKEDGIEVGKSLKADLEAFLELHSAGEDDSEIVLPPEEYAEGEIPEPLVPYVPAEDDDGSG